MTAIPPNFIILPSLDLKGGESLEQALSNLSQLEQQFSKICSNLDQRLANLKGKLGQVNQRIGVSRQKIDILKEINEAITIVSPSKFVKVYKKGQDVVFHQTINPDYVNNKKIPPFNYENTMNLNTNIANAKPHTSTAGGLLGNTQSSGSHHHEDELRKIVKLSRGGFVTKRELFSGNTSILNQKFEGLGRTPSNIKYIDSLVVFNSRQNPYQKYYSFDNLMSNSQINIPKKKQHKDKDKINLQEAPRTLMEGDVLTQFGTEDHRFKPEARELPMLVAPSSLNLQGIVNYNLGNMESDAMAPSRGGTVNRPTVPDPKFTDQPQTAQMLEPSTLSLQRFSTIQLTGDGTIAPNPSSTNTQTSTTQSSAPSGGYSYAPVISQNKQINIQAPTISAPQQTVNMTSSPMISSPQKPQNPGPVQNTTAPAMQPTTGNQQPQPVNTAAPGGGAPNQGPAQPAPQKASGSRAALLDEIRNPKVKLKKAAVDEEKPAMERKPGTKPAPAMNHLDHLKQQIQLRFQALNKNKTKEESSDEEDD